MKLRQPGQFTRKYLNYTYKSELGYCEDHSENNENYYGRPLRVYNFGVYDSEGTRLHDYKVCLTCAKNWEVDFDY